MDDNFIVVLFKNKSKKKIINKFKTFKRANAFYKKLLDQSENVIFPKVWENANPAKYELGLLEKKGKNELIYMTDELGRNVKVVLEDDQYSFKKIENYNTEERIYDLQINKKISIDKFISKYLSKKTTKMVSSLNNKIIVQYDDNVFLFSTKTTEESHRLIDCLTKHFIDKKIGGTMFVKDVDSSQRAYLYSVLEQKGFSKKMLYRLTTTHSPR